MFTGFKEIVENRHEHIRNLRAQRNKKVIAYLCSYVPEELIYAAGIIPVRIMSNEETPALADRYMQSYYCTFARSILHQGIKGDYDYLDGLVTAYTCTTMRLAFDNWHRAVKLPFYRFLVIPSIIDTPEAATYYLKELQRFRKDLEDLIGHPIADDDIWEALRTYDTNRNLIMKLFEYRKLDNPLVTGLEAFQVTLSGMLTDKNDHNRMLENVLKDITGRDDTQPCVGRLMLVGSPVDNLHLLSLIENLGAIVVTDDTCTGTRYLFGTTPLDMYDDPLEAIVHRYLISRVPCPTKYSPTRWVQCTTCPFREASCFSMSPDSRETMPGDHPFSMPERVCRFRHMLQLAVNHKVEGVIAVLHKFCDPHGYDYHHVNQVFESVGVPTLFLEEENVIAEGQLLTRVQAFLEMLQPVEYLIEPGILDVVTSA